MTNTLILWYNIIIESQRKEEIMKFNMTWDGVIEQGGYTQLRFGVHAIIADNEKDAVKQAYDFFRHGAFIDWDAIVENDDFSFVIASDD